MVRSKPPRNPPKPGYPRPTEEGDRIFGFKKACLLFDVTPHVMYKWNDTSIPYYKPGKTCFYLYSEVMNWFLSHDQHRDTSKPYQKLPLSQLPKCWPIYPGGDPIPVDDSERQEADDRQDARAM